MGKGPYKMKGSPMQRNFGISPVKQVELGPASKRIIKKGKKVVKKVSEKVSDFIKVNPYVALSIENKAIEFLKQT